MNSYIITHTGRNVRLFRPVPSEFCGEDIAHSLSQLCRFTGHTPKFYSVAEHSCLVHDAIMSDHPLAGDELAMAGLLHDAAEAYIGDIATPLKRKLVCQFDYAEGHSRSIEYTETLIRAAIFRSLLGWTDAMRAELLEMVKPYDREALETEMHVMFGMPEPAGGARMSIECWGPERAKEEFLRRLRGHGHVGPLDGPGVGRDEGL